MTKALLFATFLCGAAATFWCAGVCRADDPAATEIGVADLLKLPDEDDYKVDPYLQAAQSLQAMGKEKACALLVKLAAKDDQWPHTRTVTLCRMLFKAKRGGTFDRSEEGAPTLPGGTEVGDWPLEPITIVDGVPFRVARGYVLGGLVLPATFYLAYCGTRCEWNDFKFKPKSRDEKKKALESLFMSPKLKGKLEDSDKDFFKAQIK